MILQTSKIEMTFSFFQHQAQQLLQMICYPNGVPNQVDGSEPDVKQIIQRVLQNLDIWGLRVSLLELQLLFKQATTQQVRNQNQGLRTIKQANTQWVKNQNQGLMTIKQATTQQVRTRTKAS